jgi:hypothetical protein
MLSAWACCRFLFSEWLLISLLWLFALAFEFSELFHPPGQICRTVSLDVMAVEETLFLMQVSNIEGPRLCFFVPVE